MNEQAIRVPLRLYMPRSRDVTLAVLRGQSVARVPVFSGLPSLTEIGLNAAGVRYSEAHSDAARMAAASASTFEQFGFQSAVVPFDLCVEAEALGCGVDFQGDVEGFLAPVVSQPLSDLPTSLPDDLPHSGRMGLVAESIRLLKAGVGREVAIGAWLSGPFTLAWQCLGAEAWLGQLHDSPRILAQLGALAQWLARVGEYYFEAGADFLTVHEMGGSPQVIGPANFRALVKPSLARLFDALPSPKVLSVCGDTNASVADLAVCGADALSVDHLNDLSRTRRLLGPDAVLLGNFDPVGVLSHATPAQITSTVQSILSAGANAIWPGCDLWPEVPSANFHALMAAVRVNDSHAAVRE